MILPLSNGIIAEILTYMVTKWQPFSDRVLGYFSRIKIQVYLTLIWYVHIYKCVRIQKYYDRQGPVKAIKAMPLKFTGNLIFNDRLSSIHILNFQDVHLQQLSLFWNIWMILELCILSEQQSSAAIIHQQLSIGLFLEMNEERSNLRRGCENRNNIGIFLGPLILDTIWRKFSHKLNPWIKKICARVLLCAKQVLVGKPLQWWLCV